MSAEFMRCGLIGHPVAHSRSPEIHRAFAKQAGIALDYALIDATPDEFGKRTREFFAANGLGLNVTLPHKPAAFALADEAGDEAKRSGVANVLTRLTDGRVRADNTDGIGLIRDLTRNLDFELAGRCVLIAGAGGAAAGIIPVLLDADMREIVIHNRTPKRAEQLIRRFDDSHLTASTGPAETSPFGLVINATSASLDDARPDLPTSAIGTQTLAYDLVYAEHATPFMQWADALGARTTDGWGMLIEQASESFYLWYGIRPDTTSLHRHG